MSSGSATVVCILIPRFELLTAVVGRGELLRFPVALAPEPDREQVVGEVSGAAESFGVHAGMRLGEALSRCPDLRLVAADPERTFTAWESVLGALETIGAAVESARAGEAYFEAGALIRLYGGHLEGVLARARRALTMPARIGAAPSRFCAFAAAGRARPGRAARIVPAGAARAFLAPLPVTLLRSRLPAAGSNLVSALERLGVRTLGELAALAPAELADRFGNAGVQARELALGSDTALEPRPLRESLAERVELPDAVSGLQLERMLALLVERAPAAARGSAAPDARGGGGGVAPASARGRPRLARARASGDADTVSGSE